MQWELKGKTEGIRKEILGSLEIMEWQPGSKNVLSIERLGWST